MDKRLLFMVWIPGERKMYKGCNYWLGEDSEVCFVVVRDNDTVKTYFPDDTDFHILPCTGLTAAKSYRGDGQDERLIYKGDTTELVMPDGEIRQFEVDIRTVIREVVSHPDFDTAFSKVAITGVVFLWNGFELFPCIDENGKVDTSKMTIVGNIYEHAGRVLCETEDQK